MAPPANTTSFISAAAAAVGGSDDAVLSVLLGPHKKLEEGWFDDGQDDDETCDARAKRIRDLFTGIRTVLDPFRSFAGLLGPILGANEAGSIEQILDGESMVQPDPESPDARTFFFKLDARDTVMTKSRTDENYALEVSVLASKFAYENQRAAKQLVETHLGGQQYKFFNCRNAFLDQKTTQAIGFVRYRERRRWDATVYVAFRGSELTSVGDWETNFDCGLLTMGRGFGKVHKGFMKALGLQSDTGNFDEDFPRTLPEWNKWEPLPAYYAIRKWLLQAFRNIAGTEQGSEKKRVLLRIVGHSQGGALAILFATMLTYHAQSVRVVQLDMQVITMGQPRVGDSTFANYMTNNHIADPLVDVGMFPNFGYIRMVYRHDPVPRIPFDDDPTRKTNYSRYRHFGNCLYYDGWNRKSSYIGDEAMPNENYEAMYLLEGVREWLEDLKESVENAKKLNESLLTLASRFLLLFAVGFHLITNYLNAARYGVGFHKNAKHRGPRTLLRALVHCFPRSALLLLKQKAPAN